MSGIIQSIIGNQATEWLRQHGWAGPLGLSILVVVLLVFGWFKRRPSGLEASANLTGSANPTNTNVFNPTNTINIIQSPLESTHGSPEETCVVLTIEQVSFPIQYDANGRIYELGAHLGYEQPDLGVSSIRAQDRWVNLWTANYKEPLRSDRAMRCQVHNYTQTVLLDLEIPITQIFVEPIKTFDRRGWTEGPVKAVHHPKVTVPLLAPGGSFTFYLHNETDDLFVRIKCPERATARASGRSDRRDVTIVRSASNLALGEAAAVIHPRKMLGTTSSTQT